MKIIITEEQFQNILIENEDETIKKRLRTLYMGFRKGKMRVETRVYGRSSAFRDIDIDVQYELPLLHRIVVNDVERKERRRYDFHSMSDEPHTIYVENIKIESETPIPDEELSQVRDYVKEKIMRRFKQMGNADLVIRKFRAPEVKFQSDFTKGDTLKLVVGQPIEHDKFGKGEIVDLQNVDGRKIATIKFIGIGIKKIVLSLANLRTWEQ